MGGCRAPATLYFAAGGPATMFRFSPVISSFHLLVRSQMARNNYLNCGAGRL